MSLTIQEIAQAIGGECSELTKITSVEFDSRKIAEGSLFVPLVGTRDGREFIQQAITNGASASFWSLLVEQAPKDFPVTPVAGPLRAMQQLATHHLEKVDVEVVAVTGSNGKTTTRDLTASVLSEKCKAYKTQGNYNNDISLPYTILYMPQGVEKIALEMGTDHANEITELSLMIQPKAAAITTIGETHIENFGSREGIAKARMEITDGLVPDGLLVIPAGEPLLTPLAATLVQTVTTFGIGSNGVHAEVIAEEKARTDFVVEGETFTIPLPGGCNVTNTLVTYTIGRSSGLFMPEIRQGLAHVSITQNRAEWLTAGNGTAILNDVYNVNPTAMGLVLDTFRDLPAEGRRIAVLADMLELGGDSLDMHAQMSEYIDPEKSTMISLYGEQMYALKEDLNQKYPQLPVFCFKRKRDKLIEAAKQNLKSIDSIMLKGNSNMGLFEVVEQLQQMKWKSVNL